MHKGHERLVYKPVVTLMMILLLTFIFTVSASAVGFYRCNYTAYQQQTCYGSYCSSWGNTTCCYDGGCYGTPPYQYCYQPTCYSCSYCAGYTNYSYECGYTYCASTSYLYYDDRTPPTISVYPNTTAWTNGYVYLSTSLTDDSYWGAYDSWYGHQGSFWMTSSSGLYAYNNGTYTFTARDADGNNAVQTYQVTNIDRLYPTLYSASAAVPNSTWTNQNVNINISAVDQPANYYYGSSSGDGIFNITASRSQGGSFSSSGNYISVPYIGTYYVYVYDKAGNSASGNGRSVYISNIDKRAPIINNVTYTDGVRTWYKGTSYSSLQWTQNDVRAVISAYDPSADYYYASSGLRSGYGTGQQWTATRNATYNFRVEDNAGNYIYQLADIRNIDKDGPVITHSASPSTWTKDNVTVTVTANDAGIGIQSFKVEGKVNKNFGSGSQRTPGNPGNTLTGTFTAEKNGTYKVTAVDFLGHVSTYNIVIDYIDKIPPKAGDVSTSASPSNNGVYPGGVGVTVSAADAAGNDDYGASGIDKIYYSWSTSSSAPASYSNWKPGGTGELEKIYDGTDRLYYLHVKLVDKVGYELTLPVKSYMVTKLNLPDLKEIDKSVASTDITPTSIKLTWDPKGNYKKTVYEIYRAVPEPAVYETQSGSTISAQPAEAYYKTSSPGVSSYTDTPLNANRKYEYRIRAKITNVQQGVNYYTDYTVKRSAFTKCYTPNRVYLDDIGTKYVQFVWDWNDNNPNSLTKYRVVRMRGSEKKVIAVSQVKKDMLNSSNSVNEKIIEQKVLEYKSFNVPGSNVGSVGYVQDKAGKEKFLDIKDKPDQIIVVKKTDGKKYYAYRDTKAEPNKKYTYYIEAVNGEGDPNNPQSIGISRNSNTTQVRCTLPELKMMENLRAVVGNNEINLASVASRGIYIEEPVTVKYDLKMTPGDDKYDRYLITIDLNYKENMPNGNGTVVVKNAIGAVNQANLYGLYENDIITYTIDRNEIKNTLDINYQFRVFKKAASVSGDLTQRVTVTGLRLEKNMKKEAGYPAAIVLQDKYLITQIKTGDTTATPVVNDIKLKINN